MDLDDVEEIPLAAIAKPSPGKGAPPSKGAPPARRDIIDDDGNEKTSAVNLADLNLDDEPAPPAKPAAPVKGGRVAAALPAKKPVEQAASQADIDRAMRDSAGPAKAAPAAKRAAPPPPDDDADEKTSYIPSAPAKAPVKPPQTLSKPAQAPKMAAPVAKAEPVKAAAPVIEKTQAVSLEEFEKQRASLAKAKAAPASADATFLGDDEDDIPVVKAPPPKKIVGKEDVSKAAPPTVGSAQGDGDPKMIVRVGADIGKVYQLSKDLTLVGRGLDADFVINDASASRKHFNIVRTLSGWKLVDLGSGNGTKVNGNRVTEIALQQGMKIEAGGTTLEWVVDEAPAPKIAPPAAKVRETAKEDAPPPSKPGRHPGTLAPGLGGGADDDIAQGVKRRVQENKDDGKKRDASRMKFDDDKPAAKKGGGGAAADDEGDGSEKTSYSDVAALELDPNWEARRAKMRKAAEGGEDGMVAVSGDDDFGPGAGKGKGKDKDKGKPGKAAKAVEPEEEEEAPSGGGAGKKIAIGLGIVALLGGGFVAADKFAGLGIIFPKVSTTSSPEPTKVATAEPTKETKEPETKEPETKEPTTKEPETKEPTTKEPETKEATTPPPTTEPPTTAPPTTAPPTTEPPTSPPPADPKAEAAKKLAEGNTALEGKQLLLAKLKYNEAVKLDPTNDDVSTGLAKTNAQLKNWSGYVSGLKLAGEKKYADALKAMKDIPDDAPNSSDVIPFRNWVVTQHAVDLLSKAVAAYNAKDYATAKTAVAERLTLDEIPLDKPWAEAFMAAIDKAASPEGKTLETADPADPKGKTEAKPLDFKPFYSLYAKPDFDGALQFLANAQPAMGGTLPASKADAARAASLEAPLFEIQTLYAQLMGEAKDPTKAETAIFALYKLRRGDAQIDGSLRTKLDVAIAEAFTALAKKAVEEKKDGRAQILWAMAARFDANNAAAKTPATDAIAAAKKKVADGKALLATDPDKGAAMLVEAVQVLPPDAPEAIDAWKSLEPFLKAE